MGLDWRPLGKPKKGFEKEFKELFYIIGGMKEQPLGFFDKLIGKRPKTSEQLLARFFEISIPPYITLNAPRVGVDPVATEWAKKKYAEKTENRLTLEQVFDSMNGYPVVELLPANDGIPVYCSIHAERYVFRAQFLNDCETIIGYNVLEEARHSKLAPETVTFGNKLMHIATNYSIEHNCFYLKEQREPIGGSEEQPESKAHILFSAAKWLIWWGERGHGIEADF